MSYDRDRNEGAPMVTDAEELARLTDGYLTTQLIYVAAELGVADALAEAPATATEIASRVGAQPAPLHRVLRGLAAERIVAELQDGRFELTDLGRLLAKNTAGSQQGAALARGRLYYAVFGRLLEAVRSGGTPFEQVHGQSFFEYLAARPAEMAAFRQSMASRSSREAEAVVAAYDFGRFRRLVDVGGGPGILLRAILARAPHIEGVLFDRPEVVHDATLPSVGGDFFEAVPAGADAYLLSRVIHDWDDAAALKVLVTCRKAMSEEATLIIVEAILPEVASEDPAAIRMDLNMLALLGGRERTEAQYISLLASGGFSHLRTVKTDAGVAILEARPTRT